MFNKTQLDAYNSIKAPDELYEKVVNAKPKKSKIYLIPLVSSLAACIVLIFSIAAFGNYFEPNIVLNGQQLSDSVVFYDISPANTFDMRSSPVLSLPVEMELEEETSVSVSNGFIILDTGERVKSTDLKGQVAFVWEIERQDEFPEAKMTLKSSKGNAAVTLVQNETDGSFTATIN